MHKLISFALAAVSAALLPDLAQAAEAGGAGAGMLGVGAGLAIGLAVLGAGIAQGLTTANAVQGIARNPGAAGAVQVPMIIGLALIESLALFAMVIAFMIQGKIPS